MDDEVGVRVRHGGEHVEEEAQAGLDVERPVVAPAVDRLACHRLEDQIGLAGRGDAGVDELRDVRVFQARQDRPLAAEAGGARGAEERGGEQLDGGRPLEAPVVAPRQPDAPHPAGAERPHQRVGAEGLAREVRRGEQILRVVLQVSLVAQRALFAEQALELRSEGGIAAREIGEILPPLLGGELERLVEVGAHQPPGSAPHASGPVRSACRR